MNEYASAATIQSGDSTVSSDQEISWISESQDGDTRSFNRLVLKWEKTIYNTALRMLQDREEAAEATQDVFLLAFKSIRSFRRDSKFSTWLYRIALNHCLTRIRERPPGIHISIEDGDEMESPAPQFQVAETQVGEVIRFEQRKRVWAALRLLHPDQQAVIELKFFQDLTFEEISEILETPQSTIKSRFYSGLEMLKNRLGSEV
jgi:RNA polymerase sigma-70 factor, ECF subfamily